MFNRICIVIILSFLIIIIYSCNDNNTGPNSLDFSPPRFDWTIDTLPADAGDIVVVDTNSYFTSSNLFSNGELAYHKNGVVTHYNAGFFVTYIEGTDENNIYLGGTISLGNWMLYPVLKKFSNGNFTQIEIQGDTAINNYVTDIMIDNKNNVWCGTMHGEIFEYDGYSIKKYIIDTSYNIYKFTSDIANNLYVFMEKPILDSNNIPIATDYNIYMFDNGNWSLLFQKMGSLLFYPSRYVSKRTLVTRYDSQYHGIYEFNLGNFSKVFDENITGIECYQAGGNELNDVIIYGKSNNYSYSIYHWNGFNASYEGLDLSIIGAFYYKNFIHKYNRYYLLFYNGGYLYSKLFKGILKNFK